MYSLEAGEISLINVHGHLFREHVRKNTPVAKNDQQQSEEQSIDVSRYAIEEKDGRFTLQVLFPNELFGRLIGAKGKTLKSIERKSQANVVIPRGEGAVSVTVNGRSKTSVAIAAKEIEAILSGLRDSAPFTHFISLPLTTDAQVMAKLKEVQKQTSFVLCLTFGTVSWSCGRLARIRKGRVRRVDLAEPRTLPHHADHAQAAHQRRVRIVVVTDLFWFNEIRVSKATKV